MSVIELCMTSPALCHEQVLLLCIHTMLQQSSQVDTIPSKFCVTFVTVCYTRATGFKIASVRVGAQERERRRHCINLHAKEIGVGHAAPLSHIDKVADPMNVSF